MRGVLKIYCETGLFWTVLSKTAFLEEYRNAQCTELRGDSQIFTLTTKQLTADCNNTQLRLQSEPLCTSFTAK